MSIVYSCFRCKKYKANMKSYMYKHLCKDTKCHIVSPDVLKYSEDEIIKFSLIPESKLEYLDINKENYTVTKSPIEFIDELKDIYNSKRKNCNHCNKIFERYKELEKHLFECVHISSPKNKNQYNITNNIDNSVNNTDNSTNNININSNNNNSNNINVNLSVPSEKTNKILSFNEDWCTDHLDDYTKIILFLSDFTQKYSKTLDALLENDVNKNVLIDNDSNTGMVFVNKNFQKMKLKDIVQKSMDKVQKHLYDFSKEILNIDGIKKEIIKTVSTDNRRELLNYNNETEHSVDMTPIILSTINKHNDETKINYIKYHDEISNKNKISFDSY